MNLLPMDAKGQLYRVRHTDRGVFEARIREVEHPHNAKANPNPRGWFTCEVTKIRKNKQRMRAGDLLGLYMDGCEFKPLEAA